MHAKNLNPTSFLFGSALLILGVPLQSARAQVYIPVPEVRKVYGAYAYSRSTDIIGHVYNASSRREAEFAALEACNQSVSSQDCVPVTWFANLCASIATTPDRGYAFNFDRNRQRAETKALETCREGGLEGCQSRGTVCARSGYAPAGL